MIDLDTALKKCPLVAILRGVSPVEAVEIGDALFDSGFSIIEVPLNSPEPMSSIEKLAQRFGATCLIGAGTVMTPGDVTAIARAGGRLIVMPHADLSVIEASRKAGLISMPGVATPTEGFAALAAGASALKMFPAEALPPVVLKAWRSVFPKSVRFLPVGGIGAANMAEYLAAGAAGFGIGSSLYKPGMSAKDVARNAKKLIEALEAARGILST